MANEDTNSPGYKLDMIVYVLMHSYSLKPLKRRRKIHTICCFLKFVASNAAQLWYWISAAVATLSCAFIFWLSFPKSTSCRLGRYLVLLRSANSFQFSTLLAKTPSPARPRDSGQKTLKGGVTTHPPLQHRCRRCSRANAVVRIRVKASGNTFQSQKTPTLPSQLETMAGNKYFEYF